MHFKRRYDFIFAFSCFCGIVDTYGSFEIHSLCNDKEKGDCKAVDGYVKDKIDKCIVYHRTDKKMHLRKYAVHDI